MARSTMRREPAEQTSPVPAKMPTSAPSMAASKSASANTILGLLPPSSRPTFFTFSAPLRMMCLPTSTEPVNATMSTSGEIGDYLAASPLVDMVAFTGSVEVGKHIMRRGSDNVKKVCLELGGKSPNIVFADADFDAAIDGALVGIFAGTGEVCSAGSRLIVERSIHDRFVGELVSRAMAIKVGAALDEDSEMGPLVNKQQLATVEKYVQIGLEEGATLATGGHRLEGRGYYYEPTIFVDVDNKMRIAQEEIFGPVLVVIPFDGEQEAIAIANDTIYGLAGAVWTKDVTKAMRVVKALRAGITWVNTY